MQYFFNVQMGIYLLHRAIMETFDFLLPISHLNFGDLLPSPEEIREIYDHEDDDKPEDKIYDRHRPVDKWRSPKCHHAVKIWERRTPLKYINGHLRDERSEKS